MEIQLIFLIVALIKTDVITGQAQLDYSALLGGQTSRVGISSAAMPGLMQFLRQNPAQRQTAVMPNIGSMMAALKNSAGGGAGAVSPSMGLNSMFGGGAGGGAGATSASMGLNSLFGGGAGGGLLGGMTRMIGAQYMIERKRKLLKRYIDLYENEGCVDPFDKLPNRWKAMAAKNLINGCSSPQANLTCMMVQTQVVKPHMMALQRQLANSPLTQGISQVNAWNSLSKLGLIGQGRGLSASLPLMTIGSTGPLASSLARITEMAERHGEIRQRFIPLQCQDIRHQMMPSLSMSICCPGPVMVPDGVQFMAMQGRLHEL
ncbi:uncharacterized protein LOC121386668 isoform X3 [Gigantopelta aegis]|uniref:uncharacterized protein LOC121386668 isoform X2 n=1 Tax=Gigantopelta aegis TaxID=1735272 RepID=UPI001B88DAF2|nr:uncharacterized protein LOC121386668 isoform X2 [Gigantopelta aegis]XP_041373586.1 uncharacterized protein LOC121386668 isoform X3 [Gigantopelta aegis]